MWIKFLCWFVGHKTMIKACTGETIPIIDRFTGQEIKVMGYKWQREKKCIRCGAEVWK